MTIRAPHLQVAFVAALLAVIPAHAAERTIPVETQLRQIVERPLFARSRQPGGGAVEAPPAPKVEAPVAPEPPPAAVADVAAQVMGVLIAPPVRKALLRFGDGQPEWLSEGATAEGWRVSRIEDAGVVLSGAGGDIRLDLHEPAQ